MKKNPILKFFTTLAFAALFCLLLIPAVRSEAATVKLNKTKKTLTVGKSVKLKLKNAKGTVAWKSTDDAVATVSSTGKVKAVGVGSCKIKATCGGKTYSCKIKVKAKKTQAKPIAYGDTPFSTFSLTDRAGKKVDNSVFEGAQLTLVNFWEYWCGPCVREMPELEKLYENYKDRGLNVIGIYGDDDGTSVDEVLDSAGTTYTILCDPTSRLYSENMGNGYVPFTMFVDGYGNIISSTADSGSMSYAMFELYVKAFLPSAEAGHFVFEFLDEAGKPVQGVKITFCAGDRCMILTSGSDGRIEVSESGKTFSATVMTLPEGYKNDLPENLIGGADCGGFGFVLKRK
jgi:peroxiredoxin